MNNNDTIFALSSGHGKAGVAVIRISGDNLHDIFSNFIHKADFQPRHAYFCSLMDHNGDLIDQCLAIYFPAPYSFTGQDVIELHTHGAPAVINAVFEFLKTFGMRMAEPGEFSRRAFYNNKMDLADVDGLAALLDAQTDKQRQHALKSMLGHDSEIYNTWRKSMVDICAYAAATMDYSPDDLPASINEILYNRTQDLYTQIDASLQRYNTSRAIHGGINIVLAGETNVGKSSIFNYIVGSNRAIVSDIAGTTRDVVSSNLDIDGYLINLSDTAGLRETDDTIENIGIERTHNEIKNADIVIHVFTPDQEIKNIIEHENCIVIVNKSDTTSEHTCPDVIYTSTKTGDGMSNLMTAIKNKIHSIMDTCENTVIVNARTKSLLEIARQELSNALANTDSYDIFAEHVRYAADAIGKILGTITANEVLDATFGQLCLGK